MIGHVIGTNIGHLVRNGAALAAMIGLLLVAAAVYLSIPTFAFGVSLFVPSSAVFVTAGGMRGR